MCPRVPALQGLRGNWEKLYFMFSTSRLFSVHPFANLRAISNALGEAKATLDQMAESPFLPGVMKKYEEVESLLGVLQGRVAAVETCQVGRRPLTRG